VGDAAVQHDGGPVGDAEGGLGELLDQHDGHARPGDLGHQLVELGDDDRGQAHGDLVEQEDLGLPGQRPRDCQHLLLTAGERARHLAATLLEPGELLVRPGFHLGRADAVAVRRHAQVVPDDEVREDATALGDGDDAGMSQEVGRPVTGLDTVDAHAARRRAQAAVEDLEQRALAGAVGPEDGEDRPRHQGSRPNRGPDGLSDFGLGL
jgi:hypothetical protein